VRIVLLAPGKAAHPGAVAWVDDLAGRIARITPYDRQICKVPRRTRSGLDAQARRQECDALLQALPPTACAVLLDIGGRSYDSDQFYAWLLQRIEGGTRDLWFVLGGPDGVEDRVRQRADHRLSLTAMTLPHDLAEVVLLEQLYRALTRWKNLPYHR
jgi:23S rRNA (pseudouridine1915-N3)-methyltransferase